MNPIMPQDLRAGDRYLDITYGTLTITEVRPPDGNEVRVETDRGRRYMRLDRPVFAERLD